MGYWIGGQIDSAHPSLRVDSVDLEAADLFGKRRIGMAEVLVGLFCVWHVSSAAV